MGTFLLSDEQRGSVRAWIDYLLPSVMAGAIAWAAFLTLGQTPLVRASGLALVIAGMALTLRSMGGALAVIGALALAFSPAFWSQTGGIETYNPLLFGAAVIGALIAAGVIWMTRKRPSLAVAGAAILMIVFFLFPQGLAVGRSLRLTTLLTVALLYLLIDALTVSNPRPDSPPTGTLRPHHAIFLLMVFALGVLNDPMFVLASPALLLGLFLTRARLSVIYWMLLIGAVIYGAWRLIDVYAVSGYWLYPAAEAIEHHLRVPFLLADGWREPLRWVDLLGLVAGQFTVIGGLLGVVGLARLSRWYPPIGVVTMIAFAAYAFFGLLYFGGDREVLLLPLLMIQVFWMTYAFSTLRQWLEQSATGLQQSARWLAPAVFVLLPMVLLLRIIGI